MDLRRFFSRGPGPKPANSFEGLSDAELEAQFAVERYGDFWLTGAVRPAPRVVPRQAYRHDAYVNVPVLLCSASREHLFDLFLSLLAPLGPVVDVVLETSHGLGPDSHVDHYRQAIDLSVLESTLWDFDDLLLNDGCTGIAVLNPTIPQEVQFDEHKLLIVYYEPLGQYEQLFQAGGVPCDETLKVIIEAEHVHASSDLFREQFDQLRTRLGIE